jgi:hypothetical protein
MYHVRMDRPFEQPLAKLFTALVERSKEEGTPREIAVAWVEDMDLEQYQSIGRVDMSQLPTFVQNT